MATVHDLLSRRSFFNYIQQTADEAQVNRFYRHKAVVILQRMTRGYLMRKHITWLSYNAIIIQCAWRVHMARKAYREALKRHVNNLHHRHYARAATMIQALWRGYWSRKVKFCYFRYRRWLATVKERGERRVAECAEYTLRSRADDLKILEEEARQWLAFVVFKLHHLLRTTATAGIYSLRATTELSEFEKLLKSIQYTNYMTRLKKKYDEFVKITKSKFSNKRLFPVIGEGADYWYLSLAEMYKLTEDRPPPPSDGKFKNTHHGKIHEKPFLWRKVPSPRYESQRVQGPFHPHTCSRAHRHKDAPPPTPADGVSKKDSVVDHKNDPRFHLYVEYYKPDPDILNYIDFHVNVLLNRKKSIMRVTDCQSQS